MKKDRRCIYIITAVFFLGLTLGSAAGAGVEPGLDFSVRVGFEDYLAAAFMTSLPFWCAALLPKTARHRLLCGGAGTLLKGALLGCASAFILSRGRGWYFYCLNILPQIVFSVPLYIFTIAALVRRPDAKYTYSSILGSFAVSILLAFASSCVQYLIFRGLYTIQGIFITKI